MINAGFLVALLLLAVPASGAGGPPVLVTVGEVTDTSAVVWVRGQSWGKVTVRYGVADRPEEKRGEVNVSPGAHLTGKLPLVNLAPASRYRYTVSQGAAEVQGEFVTAPAPGMAAPVRFAWSGDLGSRTQCRHLTDGYPIFRALARFRADFFIFAGDTIYADHACAGPDRVPGYDFVSRKLPDFWAKHRYNREDPGVQEYFRTLSVYAIWDDHEVRNDFSGPSDVLMPVGRRAFVDYFPISPPADDPGRL